MTDPIKKFLTRLLPVLLILLFSGCEGEFSQHYLVLNSSDEVVWIKTTETDTLWLNPGEQDSLPGWTDPVARVTEAQNCAWAYSVDSAGTQNPGRSLSLNLTDESRWETIHFEKRKSQTCRYQILQGDIQ